VVSEPPPHSLSLGCRREEFDVPAEITYVNTASLSPLTHRVRDMGERALARRARPWTIADEDWFTEVERLRALSKRTGAEILTVARPREPGASWTDGVLAALDERVAIVSVPNVHWTDGSLVDLDTVAARARELGARLIVDASQSAGAMPLDVARLRPDYLVSAGYKWLLGPFGVSYLYVAPEHREGEPLEENWINRARSQEFARLVEYRDDYQPGARRFDAGQRTSFHLVPMAVAALEQLLEWEVPRIAATLAETTAEIAEGVAALGYGVADPGARGPHMLGAELPAEPVERVALELARAGVHAAARGRALRISPHLHNTPEEAERLVGALEGLAPA